MLRLLINCLVAVFVLGLSGLAAKVQAQTSACDLQISVFEYKGEQNSEKSGLPIMDKTTVLADAKVNLYDSQTKKSFQSSLVDKVPYFRKLHEGIYEATISKDGYKKTKQTISLQCQNANAENKLCQGVLLRPGNKDEFVNEVSTLLTAPTGSCSYVLPSKNNSDSGSKNALGEVLNRRAVKLMRPEYPAAARALKLSGEVDVQVKIDKAGNVIFAKAVVGHSFFYSAAERAARDSKFPPTLKDGEPVEVEGIIFYVFIP